MMIIFNKESRRTFERKSAETNKSRMATDEKDERREIRNGRSDEKGDDELNAFERHQCIEKTRNFGNALVFFTAHESIFKRRENARFKENRVV